jgi:hypothetical protein
MNYTWFYIFTLSEFEAAGVTSRTYTVILDGLGQTDLLVTKGNLVGLTYEGVFLPIQLGDANPFALDGYAVYIDEDDQVWLGIEVEA